MSRPPILSERLSKKIKGLLKGASRRGARSRGRRVSRSPSVKFQATSPKAPAPAANGTVKATQRKLIKLGSFWSNLFWVRPWLLVIALWLTFVLMIALALAGLSNPGREMVLDPVDSGIVGQPLSAPDAAAVSRLIPRDEIPLTQQDPAATLPPVERSLPAWPLLVMVAACAGGCMLMSNQGLLDSESRRGRRRTAPQVGARPVGPRSVRAATGKRQRRSKQRRLAGQRPASQVMTFRLGQKLHNTSPQPRPMGAKPVSFAVDSTVDSEIAPSVTVVPDNETSPLDWKEGSLAHKLDVRNTRSIRSFL